FHLGETPPREREGRGQIGRQRTGAWPMSLGLLAQYVMNGVMLGMMDALVAVGFTLFFGVLDVIKFSHGDVLTVGGFAALATFVGLQAAGLSSHVLALAAMLVAAVLAMALLGVLIARY